MSASTERLGRFIERFTGEATHMAVIRLYRRAVFLWLLLSTLFLLPAAEHFWSPLAYINPSPGDPGALDDRPLRLLVNGWGDHWRLFVAGQIVALLLGLAGWFPRLATLVVYFFTLNLDHKAWVLLNGGNNLVEVMLVYLMFMRDAPAPPTASVAADLWHRAGNVLSNVAFCAARVQLVTVYAVAGLTKLQGALWRHGVALYYVFNTDEFTCPFAQNVLARSDLIVTLGTYMTLLFMLSFPFLIWFRRTRPVVLAFGVFLHLNIAFVMGLLDFGFAMITAYVLFLTRDQGERAWALLRRMTRPTWARAVVRGLRPCYQGSRDDPGSV